MAKDEEIKSVVCPVCKAIPEENCVDSSGVSTNLHVARRRRWRLENSKNTP